MIRAFASAPNELDGEGKIIRRGMTSNPTAVEAEQVATYLTQAVSHHGQMMLIPQHAGRARKQSFGPGSNAKGKRRTAKPKRVYVVRADHGNTEPRVELRTPEPRTKKRNARAAVAADEISPRPSVRQEGSGNGTFDEDIEIPDYPPPTFEEAISTAALRASTWVPQASAVNLTTVTPASHQSPQAGAAPSPLLRPHLELPNPATRSFSIIVEPSSSPQTLSPTTPSTALPSPLPTISALQANANLNTLDSDSDSPGIVTRPLDVAQRQWEDDRRKGLTWQDRAMREWGRHHAVQIELPLAHEVPQPETGRPRSQSQMLPERPDVAPSQTRLTDSPPRRVPASWRETLDEPTLTQTPFAPALKRGRLNSMFPRAARSLPPTSRVRPYDLNAPDASLSDACTQASVQTRGEEVPASSHRRRLFSRGKGHSLSDGDMYAYEEPLDRWEVISAKDVPADTTVHVDPPEQSTTATSSMVSDRQKGPLCQDCDKREWERHLAARTELTLAEEVSQPEAGPSRSKSQMQSDRPAAAEAAICETPSRPSVRQERSVIQTPNTATFNTRGASAPVTNVAGNIFRGDIHVYNIGNARVFATGSVQDPSPAQPTSREHFPSGDEIARAITSLFLGNDQRRVSMAIIEAYHPRQYQAIQ
ncbi:hypothetical protein FIBSPDRAFT_1039344 [Athelia psychrophila]|uniref:Uncharacterized protein n=1 Tax=Athelia psychrophila TaxID=1759441 RepID=A0A166RRD1_9AGAM|nr:hypothetical protein FIBSPDRAFT_1039344 [Fibularhizoctonia sp. CBS 109695]